MKQKLFLLVLFISLDASLSSFADAALPPYWQRAKELKAIAASTGIATAVQDPVPLEKGLSSGMIDAIECTGTLPTMQKYSIRSGQCTLDVEVRYKPDQGPALPGLIQFEVFWAEAMRCRN